MRSRLIALFVLASCASAEATPLTPEAKAALMKGTNDSYLETQVKQAANKAMTVGQLQTYCDCYGRAFADFMQAEDIEKNKETLTPETTRKAAEVSRKCAASTLKK
jgi:hypothetical protein